MKINATIRKILAGPAREGWRVSARDEAGGQLHFIEIKRGGERHAVLCLAGYAAEAAHYLVHRVKHGPRAR